MGRSRGIDRERDVCDLLDLHGWVCVRSAGSHGVIDVIAVAHGSVTFHPANSGRGIWMMERAVLLIEVKSTAGGPYERFGPSERKLLREAARKTGGDAFLAWWPPGAKEPQWLASESWPQGRVSAAPPGPIGTIQGAVVPDMRGPSRPRRRSV